MALEWITPKTDWTLSTPFTYVDYNRIRNNLLYLNDMFNETYPDKAVELDLGEAKTGYTNEYFPSEFNAFEEALISFTRIGRDVNIGKRGYYSSNSPFISADALNRIESCCVRWKNQSFIEITRFCITPNSAVFEIGDTKTFNVVIEPESATNKSKWECPPETGLVTQKTSDATFTATWNNGAGDLASQNFVDTASITKGSTTYSMPYAYRKNKDCLLANYVVTNTNKNHELIYSEPTSMIANSTGSLMQTDISQKPYAYHEFVLIGNDIDKSNISTLLSSVLLLRDNDNTWGDSSGSNYHDDRKAPWRSVFQDVIDNEFSGQLKNALQSVTKTVHSSGTSTISYSSKYHLLSLDELGFTDSHVKPLSNVTYPYLINNGIIFAEKNGSRLNGRTTLSTRSLWYDSEGALGSLPPDNRCGLTIEDTCYEGTPIKTSNWSGDGSHKYIEPWESMVYNQPLIFLNKTIHVKQFLGQENGLYTFDWTGTSNLTLNDIPLGSRIIDALGTNAVTATAVEIWNASYKIGSISGSAGYSSNGQYVKVYPENCSTINNLQVKSYNTDIAEVVQGTNKTNFTVYYKQQGTTYIEASLDGKSHKITCIVR